jgi:hypothetical protein
MVKNRRFKTAEKVLGAFEEWERRTRMLWEAAHRELLDPDDMHKYFIGPRAWEIEVEYIEEMQDGPALRQKAKLSELLDEVRHGKAVSGWKWKIADPRELFLKCVAQAERLLTRIAEVGGFLAPAGSGTTTNVQVNVVMEAIPTVVRVLQAFPDALEAVRRELVAQAEAERAQRAQPIIPPVLASSGASAQVLPTRELPIPGPDALADDVDDV